MIKFKNKFVGLSIFITGIVFGQGSFVSTNYYPPVNENSSPNYTVADKLVLSPKEKIDITVESMFTDPVLHNANWGFVVYDPKAKKIISSYNETTPLVPASTTKLLTTETALSLLGENFRWTTQLEYSGNIDENGVLTGNLYIVGSGDPSLGTNKAGANSYNTIVKDFIQEIKNSGIKKIIGDIVIQTAVFKDNKIDYLPENIVWKENGKYFLPVGSTANINPRNEKLITKSSALFSENKKYYYISPYANKLVYADDYEGADFITKLPEAPAYLANTLRTSMLKSGLSISGKVLTKMLDQNSEIRTIISSYKSPTLGEIVFYTNQHSDNALAEATLRMVGFQKKGDQTSESGRSVVVEHLNKISFDSVGLNYIDGSGLSRSNTVTPIAQVKFLSSVMDKNYFKAYFDSLPIGGQTGTLKRMFYGNGYGNVFAKTGTLNRVKTLAGYIKTYSGKTLVFSLLVNNYNGSVDQVKNRMEQILEQVMQL